MADLFQAPVPGQSLTDEPRNAPWENPPDLNTVEEAAEYYIKRLSKEKALDDMSLVFQLGGDLDTVTETVVTMGTMKGVHSVDVQMLVKPVVAEYIRLAMSTYGVDVQDTMFNKDEMDQKLEEGRMDAILRDAIERSIKENGKDEGTELLQDMQAATEEQAETPEFEESETAEYEAQESEVPTAEPVGLMARG